MANIKKENEVTKVTNLGDNDCIRATLENGQSVSIKKSDLMPIIKDEIGKLLGNADALSTFTNVLVNNGQTLGKATIENLASVVSGDFKVKLTDLDVLDHTIPILFGDINSSLIGMGLFLHLSSDILCFQIYVTFNNILYYRIRLNSGVNWGGWNILSK